MAMALPLMLMLMMLMMLLPSLVPAAPPPLASQGQALLQLRRAIDDPNGHLASWSDADLHSDNNNNNNNNINMSSSIRGPCGWEGVICDPALRSVVGLDLSNRNLSGTVAGEPFLLLPSLSSLNLSCNAFSGAFPAAAVLASLDLASLDISRNFFVGGLAIAGAVGAGRRLAFFSAFSNNFSGPLPAGFEDAYAASLEHLDLGGSYFEGAIPASYGRLSSLAYLGLAGNLLSGGIPPELGSLGRLQHLLLGYNRYDGGIPAELGRLSGLRYLDLCCTNLSGPIPAELGNLTRLDTLFLYRNQLAGPIPGALGGMRSLMSLDLSVNYLSGALPAELSRLSNLTLLSLMYNGLSGPIPAGIAALPNLLTLLIWNNSFDGELPRELGTRSPLQWLDASSNRLRGPVPPDLCRRSNLTKLILFSNALSGPIPPGLARCASLVRVRVHGNALSGAIPLGFGSLPRLTRLELQHNFLVGSIPVDFSAAANAGANAGANASGYAFGDDSSSSRLSYLDLSYNLLDGALPPNLWALPSIQSFLAAGNSLSGPIAGDFGACSTLAVLVLSHNRLSGPIPPGISGCRKLIAVELQQNRLTGPIPEALATMPNLGVLDLSGNLLSGAIPELFQSSTTLESFNVSYNNLSGPVPTQGMFKTASAGSFAGNPGLCGGMLGRDCDGDDGYNADSRRAGEAKARIGVQRSMLWLIGWASIASLAAISLAAATGRCLLKQPGIGGFFGGRPATARGVDKDGDDDDDDNAEHEWPWRLVAFQRLSFTSADILNAVKLDENIIGKGASGVVYRAEMPSGEVVAVKKLYGSASKATTKKKAAMKAKKKAGGGRDAAATRTTRRNGFQIEADLLGSIRHRNIVRLLGYCSNNAATLLVYEHMPNGSLYDALHTRRSLHGWAPRYNVAAGVAQGLCYLHHDCFPPVMHRDVKSSNVLLDAAMEARLADFGLAKLLLATADEEGDGEEPTTMSRIVGSYGYIAPEFAYTLRVDEKIDIYSFGVVLLELLTGRRPIDAEFRDSANVAQWVRARINGRDGMAGVLDEAAGAACGAVRDEMLLVLRVALLCTSPRPRDRPSMRDVVAMLAEAKPRRKDTSSLALSSG